MTLNKVIIVLKFKVEGIEQHDEADIFYIVYIIVRTPVAYLANFTGI